MLDAKPFSRSGVFNRHLVYFTDQINSLVEFETGNPFF